MSQSGLGGCEGYLLAHSHGADSSSNCSHKCIEELVVALSMHSKCARRSPHGTGANAPRKSSRKCARKC